MDGNLSRNADDLSALGNEMTRLGVMGGPPADANRRIKIVIPLRTALEAFTSAEGSFKLVHVESSDDATRIYDGLEKSLATAKQILKALELLRRDHLRSKSAGPSLAHLFDRAIEGTREIAAMISFTAGTNDYIQLGYQATMRPAVEPPPDDFSSWHATG